MNEPATGASPKSDAPDNARPKFSRPEKAFNLLMGTSVLSWGILGVLHAPADDRITIVRLGIAALHVLVAVLFVVRTPFIKQAGIGGILLCMPTFVAGGLLFRQSAAPADWPLHAQAVFGLGLLIAMVALASLGRSFAIMPAYRRLVKKGLYGRLRHPAYLGELLMALACMLSAPKLGTVVAFTFVVPLMVLRVLVEERLLSTEPNYREYARVVRYRLLPFIW